MNTGLLYVALRTSHQLMKDICGALKHTLGNVERAIQQLEPTMVTSTMHHGLLSLHDEIFLYALEIAFAETETRFGRKEVDALIEQLSLVSRKFRYGSVLLEP